MPLYKTVLVRSFEVIIDAKNEDDALWLAEFYVGYGDHSNISDREKFQFEIKHIELTENDTLETAMITDTDEYTEFQE